MKDNLWYWMNERHGIFLARKANKEWPWTEDPILQKYRFCNVFREEDVVTKWIDEHIRRPFRDDPNLWLYLCIARQFNFPETLSEFPIPFNKFNPDDFWQVLLKRQAAGEKRYTSAYMVTATQQEIRSGEMTKDEFMCYRVIGDLWCDRLSFDSMWKRGCPTLQHVHGFLMLYTGWGPFMAYEVVTDLCHTHYLQDASDRQTWASAGPGAFRGLNRYYGRPLNQPIKQEQANSEMHHLLMEAQGLMFNGGLMGKLHNLAKDERILEMRDIEHSLCEYDKWCRVKLGEGSPRQLYRHV